MGATSKAIKPEETSVILLQWAPEHDDLKVKAEVDKLHNVFETKYGYNVYNKSITTSDGVKAQQQAHAFLAEFVCNEDRPHGLLIIYFAGHGYSDYQTSPGDINITGRLTPVTTKDKEAERAMRQRTAIIWSQVGNNDKAHVFGYPFNIRLLQRWTIGPANARGGRRSFTHTLTSVLSDFAYKKPFTTQELRNAIQAHEDFPEDQKPVLSFRRLPGEHIVLSSKCLEQEQSSSTLSKTERFNELKNKQSVDLRFWSTVDEVRPDHLDSVADILKPLIHSSGAQWERIDFVKTSSVDSLLHKAIGIWKDRTLTGKTRHPSPSTPIHGILDSGVPSSEVAKNLTLQIQTGPFASPTSEVVSTSSIGGPDCVSIQLPRIYPTYPTHGNEPIMYHVKAIGQKLRPTTWWMIPPLLSGILFCP